MSILILRATVSIVRSTALGKSFGRRWCGLGALGCAFALIPTL
jgi:hypothetical protein